MIEPDLSNAVPFLAAAVVSGGIVRIAGWPAASIQPADAILSILEKLGSVVQPSSSYLEVQGAKATAASRSTCTTSANWRLRWRPLPHWPHPASVSKLTGIAHLRGHETDRLAALSAEINGLGGQCEEVPDGLVITATPLHGGRWRSYADHRMATAGAIVGLRVPGVEVEDIATTSKTLPDFPQMWADMLAGQSTMPAA